MPVSNPPYTAPGPAQSTPVNANGGKGNLGNATPNPDQLSQLNPTSLGEGNNYIVHFPATIFKEEQSNSLAVHRYPNQPGARVENMGLDEARYHVRAHFTNSIYPGKNENWKSGLLFDASGSSDGALNNLRFLLSRPGNKTFMHPLDGEVTVQVKDWSFEFNAKGPRDGTIVDMLLIQTIDDSTSLSGTLPPPAGSGLSTAAANLDASIANDPAGAPPGLSLGQFFSQVTNLIQQAASYPANAVGALNDQVLPVIGGIGSVATALIASPGYALNNVTGIVQSYKSTILGATSSYNAAVAYDSNSIGNFQTTIGTTATFAPASYGATSVSAFQAVTAVNNTSSQSAPQLIQKMQVATNALMQYYIAQNTSTASPIIANLRQYMYQLQQAQTANNATQSYASSQTSNNTQNYTVTSCVTVTNTTWSALSTRLNNSVDNLLSLNQNLVQHLWIPANTTVYYVSS